MTKAQLVDILENSENILPKDIISHIEIDLLARNMVEIFSDEQDKLKNDKRFQENYLEIINYILITDLSVPKSRRRNFFDSSFLNNLLTIPAAA